MGLRRGGGSSQRRAATSGASTITRGIVYCVRGPLWGGFFGSHHTVAYASTRTHHGAPPAAFAARYRPTGPVSRSTDGSIDAWLTERYCLYSAAGKQAVWRADIDHTRWPL